MEFLVGLDWEQSDPGCTSLVASLELVDLCLCWEQSGPGCTSLVASQELVDLCQRWEQSGPVPGNASLASLELDLYRQQTGPAAALASLELEFETGSAASLAGENQRRDGSEPIDPADVEEAHLVQDEAFELRNEQDDGTDHRSYEPG